MPQGGRAPPKKAAAADASQLPKAAGTKDSWQRSSGAFSGAAKKDYLKWKRQQKAARVASSSDDEAARTQHQQSANHGALSADAARPLQYRALYPVPAEPFCMPAASAQSHDHLSDSSTAAPFAAAAAPAASAEEGGGPAAAVVYTPRLDPAEVGFTPAGFQLDMPARPQWQVRRAAQPHNAQKKALHTQQAPCTVANGMLPRGGGQSHRPRRGRNCGGAPVHAQP